MASAPPASLHHQPPSSTSLNCISLALEFHLLLGPQDGLVAVINLTNLNTFILLLEYYA